MSNVANKRYCVSGGRSSSAHKLRREQHSVEAAGPSEAPTVSVVVAPVVQKTVPLFTELTARTDATDTVEIRAA